jgi:hypothetical protein
MTHERAGRILAGFTVLGALALGYFHHPLWLIAVGGAAFNLALSGITDRCLVKDLLIRLGFPGERDLGRAEAGRESAPPKLGSPRPRLSRKLAPTSRTGYWQKN